MNSANCAELPRKWAVRGVGLAAVCPIHSYIPAIERAEICNPGESDGVAGGKLSGPDDGFTCCLLPD
jgi:hypothetical protein